MTVIRPNSISGITSITAQANEINVFRSNGLLAGLNLNGVNFNTTAGISTLAALKVTGNVDIAGVLTYQDVTNVDSLGIGTFRTGINVSGGQLDVGSNIKLGNAGVITATSFVGSGAQLTGITGTTINNNADNRIITGSGTANTLEGESTLNYGSNQLTFSGTATPLSGTGHNYSVNIYRDGGGGYGYLDVVTGSSNHTGVRIRAYHNGTYNNVFEHTTTDYTSFSTGGSERLRINSNGQLLVGTTTTPSNSNSKLRVHFDQNTSSGSAIEMSHSTNGADKAGANLGLAIANGGQSTNAADLYFSTASGGSLYERLRIASNGDITHTGGRIFSTRATGEAGLLLGSGNAGGATVYLDGDSNGDWSGTDYAYIRHNTGGDLEIVADNPANAGNIKFFTNSSTERMRIRSDGHVQLQHGLTGLSGGGVIVCAAKSSSGTANQSNYKVDFVVPMGDLGTKQEYEDIQAQFSSGQTGKDYSHSRGGSGILIATVQNDYYWGFRTKIYHITTYGNNSSNVTQLNLLHNYGAAGHGSNSASVDLTVQSHDGKTPTLRGTFSGDYWNSNVLTVTYIGSAVASTGNIRQLTAFDSKLTGQDPTWK